MKSHHGSAHRIRLHQRIAQQIVGISIWVLALGIALSTAATIPANPSNYLTLLGGLQPGDTLVLESGIYNDLSDVPGLPIINMNGQPGMPIIITGPTSGPHAIMQGRSSHNTIRISNSSYVEIKNLDVDGRNLGADGVNAQGTSHHITLANLYIHGVGDDQQTVGISTKAPAWNWIIRNCVITGAGTGMYLGDSSGNAPFVAGVIEHNLITDTIGYNVQIKHQNPRPTGIGLPSGTSRTLVRHNVFSKSSNSATGELARPNLLVGHLPLSGTGTDDLYEIYGNFFFQNPTEALFQGEGNIGLYNNLFVTTTGDAAKIQPHNDTPKYVRVFNNTIVAAGHGIVVSGGAAGFTQKVLANAVFAATPIQAAIQASNVTGSYSSAPSYLTNPLALIGQLDLYPKIGQLSGISSNVVEFNNFTDWSKDFNNVTHNGSYAGAYAGSGQNPGWLPRLERKPESGSTNDSTPPAPPSGLRVY
jgi:hypothetical protein